MIDKNTVAPKLEAWLTKNSKYIYYCILVLFITSSLLHFSLRLSTAGDDSTYITRAINFIELGRFPDYQAPLYPIFLSAFTAIFGINILVLKLSSLVLMLGFMILFYHTFKQIVSSITLFYSMSILSVASYFVFFSSQTFSEPLFLFVTILFINKVFSWIKLPEQKHWMPNTREANYILLVPLLAFIMYLTRTVGIGAILTLAIYFIINKDYKRATWSILSYVIFTMLYIFLRNIIWEIPLETGEQTLQLLSKNPYNASQGQETLIGFMTRFVDNSNLYLSKHFARIIGFRSGLNNTTLPVLTIALYALFTWGVIKQFKSSKNLLFTGIYITIMLGITFLSLQKLWDQDRLIIPFVPFMLVFLSSALVELFNTNILHKFSKIAIVTLFLSIGLASISSVNKIDIGTLSKNLDGDTYAGFTPDWVSYLQMINYIKKELPDDTYVACRKPNIARIYANGRKFHGIYRIPSGDAQELAQILKDRKVSHIVMGSLRKNPSKYTGESINTIQRYLSVIVKEYPNCLSLTNKFGDEEPTYLFKINYDIIFNKQH